jgi:hypothetical protein
LCRSMRKRLADNRWARGIHKFYSLCKRSTSCIERTLHPLWDLGGVSGKFSLTAGVKAPMGGPGRFNSDHLL